jgi:hypothetical protein
MDYGNRLPNNISKKRGCQQGYRLPAQAKGIYSRPIVKILLMQAAAIDMLNAWQQWIRGRTGDKEGCGRHIWRGFRGLKAD